MLKSNVLVSDLKMIQYGIYEDDFFSNLYYNNYFHKTLHKSMQYIIDKWKDKKTSDDLYLILNENLIQIVENDTIKYSAQIILPIFVDNKLDGFLIFFRIYGDYIESSINPLKTIRDFLQKELNNNFNKEVDTNDN